MDLGGNHDAHSRSLRGSTTRLSAALLGLVRTRLELASIEFAEERDRIQQQLILMVAAAGMLLFAVLFVAVWIIAYFWDTYRLTAIAVVAFVFAAAGVIMLMRRAQASRAAPRAFEATLAEFESDAKAFAAAREGAQAAPPPL